MLIRRKSRRSSPRVISMGSMLKYMDYTQMQKYFKTRTPGKYPTIKTKV